MLRTACGQRLGRAEWVRVSQMRGGPPWGGGPLWLHGGWLCRRRGRSWGACREEAGRMPGAGGRDGVGSGGGPGRTALGLGASDVNAEEHGSVRLYC